MFHLNLCSLFRFFFVRGFLVIALRDQIKIPPQNMAVRSTVAIFSQYKTLYMQV